jgi:hypothetical protein
VRGPSITGSGTQINNVVLNPSSVLGGHVRLAPRYAGDFRPSIGYLLSDTNFPNRMQKNLLSTSFSPANQENIVEVYVGDVKKTGTRTAPASSPPVSWWCGTYMRALDSPAGP